MAVLGSWGLLKIWGSMGCCGAVQNHPTLQKADGWDQAIAAVMEGGLSAIALSRES